MEQKSIFNGQNNCFDWAIFYVANNSSFEGFSIQTSVIFDAAWDPLDDSMTPYPTYPSHWNIGFHGDSWGIYGVS